ncbi:MAG: 1,4-alpha-glucan branching protein GlgB [Acidobacteria bacterium]|nr:1,4-alpha-glucan branching protein GlgB [Acidobacteriota bacterium]
MRVGYHQLCVLIDRRSVWSTLIVRPLRGVTHRFSREWRAYSVQTPIFSLHSQRSWGCGDVGDLDEFARLVANQGATVVSTLPLLSSFGPHDFEASPYRPVSRRFWNDRWIALDQVEFLAQSPAAQSLMNDTYSPSLRASWVRDGHVDGAEAFRAKRHVIQAWAATQSEFMALYESGLRSYVTDHPEVNDYARFRAAGERFGRDFRHWPSVARSGLLRWNDVDPTLVRYHLFAQWIIDSQMTDLSQRLAQRGQTLGLDIPIGVHPDGYDVWKNPDEYVAAMSIGAPADDLTSEGQTWGSPPLHPARVRENAHQQFRDALRCHMRVAGVVRIDHVMGLQRLFWVPDGASAREGLYVKMPFHELLAIVAIEAQRYGCDVVGEDLGTVDGDLREAMAHEGLRRTYVAQFAIGEDSLDPVPSGAVASFGTHDTATFLGWWSEVDLDERLALRHLSPETAALTRRRRRADRDRLVRVLGLGPDSAPGAVLDAVHAALSDSDAGLVMAQIEDLLGVSTGVNLPGTLDERPNWSQQIPRSLEELAATTVLSETLAPLRDRRGFASGGRGAPQVSRVTLFSAQDLHLFNEGRHFRLHHHLGGHPMVAEGVAGCYFAVWAPNAERVAVVGDFNGWDGTANALFARESSGVWEGFVPGALAGQAYKYRIRSRLGGSDVDKADPVAQLFEVPARTASRVWASHYEWRDGRWMSERGDYAARRRPVSVYEVHLGSWRRVPEEGDRSLTYREMAEQLPAYCREMGFTHVQFLPIMEHPFYGSWGYQTTGYFAPTSRYGDPDDFKHLVDELHAHGLGVLLDWVPSHFPSDAHALGLFDGTHLYEHADVRQRVHPDWLSWTFNYSRNEVRSFLISSACFWLEEYHVDGLRLDAVASMLYLDYSRGPGQWVANRFGGRDDLDAISFLRQCNDEVTTSFPGAMMVAEESTSWPQVTHASGDGGLGFTFKWDLGWMHDTLDYLSRDAIFRQYHQGELTFRAVYAGHERFMLPLSHDEVVHGKGSLLSKMSGDDWQSFANLRLLLGYQYTLPGKKLVFMGAELAQRSEWSHERSLDWHLLEHPAHEGVRRWLKRCNDLYVAQPALHRDDAGVEDFSWLSCDDAERSVLIWRRGEGDEELVVVANFTPVPRDDYQVAVSASSSWRVLANSDDEEYGGSGYPTQVHVVALGAHQDQGGTVVRMSLPPLALVVLQRRP